MIFTYDGFDRGMEGQDILGNFKIGSFPTLIYIPDFVTDSEQTALLTKVCSYILFAPSPTVAFLLFLSYLSLPFFRFMKLLFQSGNLLKIEGYKIGVCRHIWLFFFSLQTYICMLSGVCSHWFLFVFLSVLSRWCCPWKGSCITRM